MKLKLEPRPAGEAARVVFKEYDVPLDPDVGLPANFVQNDGSDWSLGTPSVLIPGWGVHDAWLDLDGQLWFTCNIPNRRTTIGKIDTKTGEVKLFKVAAPNGFAAQAHGMTRDEKGIIWFNVNNGRGGLGRLDPKTERIDVYMPPQGMSQTGRRHHRRLRRQGHDLVVGSRRRAALRSRRPRPSPSTSPSPTRPPNGTGVTYGMAADRDGNGWWAEMALDIIGKGEGATGKVDGGQARRRQGGDGPRHARRPASSTRPTTSPISTSRSPGRRARGAWAPTRRRTCSGSATRGAPISPASIPAPTRRPTCRCRARSSPITCAVDNAHNAWTNLWGADRALRYDPKTSDLDGVRSARPAGAEPRYVSLLEREGAPMQVVLPYFRARKVAVMTCAARPIWQALKAQAAR